MSTERRRKSKPQSCGQNWARKLLRLTVPILKRLCTPKSLPCTAVMPRAIRPDRCDKRHRSGRPEFLSMRGKAIKNTDQNPRACDSIKRASHAIVPADRAHRDQNNARRRGQASLAAAEGPEIGRSAANE